MKEYLIGKIDSSDIFKAIRIGFSNLIPITLCTSIFVLLGNIPNSIYYFFFRSNNLVEEIKSTFNFFSLSIYSFISLLILLFVSHSYSKIKKIDSIYGVSYTILTFFIINNLSFSFGKVIFEERFYNSSNIFFALLTAFLVPYCLKKLDRLKKNYFKFKNIPDEVSQSFSTILPSIVFFSVLFLIKFTLFKFGIEDLNKIVDNFIQLPIQNVSDTIFSVVVINFLKNFLWVLGINGSQVIGAIISPIINTTTLSNLNNFLSGEEVKFIFTTPFQDAFTNFGGSGCTIALFFSYMFLGRDSENRKLMKLSFIPLIFNINEPLIYGLPIIFNPILAIPFVLVPTINSGIAYFLIQVGLVSIPNGIIFPWVTPIFISGFLASGISGVILQFFLLLLDINIYSFFVKKYDKNKEKIIAINSSKKMEDEIG